jgi:hypothetical protein
VGKTIFRANLGGKREDFLEGSESEIFGGSGGEEDGGGERSIDREFYEELQ